MFGVYELQLPAFIRERLETMNGRQSGGHLGGAALMGFFSALLASPCMTAPLAGALLYITQSGDALNGGLGLFALGLGMGAPLVAFGTLGGQLSPKTRRLDEWRQGRVWGDSAGYCRLVPGAYPAS